MPKQNNQLNTFRKIHFMMCLGISIFLILSQTILKKEPTSANNIINQVAAGFSVIGVILSFVYPMILLKGNKPEHNYFVIKLVQWAILEGTALFNAIAFFLNGIQYSFFVASVVVLILISRYPSEVEKNKLFPTKIETPKFEDDRF